MQEKLDALVRTQAMQLFRQQGLHFTMQQVAEPLHISKKTIYTVYPSKEALLLDMVDHAFADIHRCKQEILAGSGTLAEGVMRPVSLPVLRQMITASIESFLADRSLAESGVQYVAVLEEMISILLEGVLPR